MCLLVQAPELFADGACEVSEAADIWAWACVVWEALHCEVPWRGFSPLQVAMAVTLESKTLPLPSDDEDDRPGRPSVAGGGDKEAASGSVGASAADSLQLGSHAAASCVGRQPRIPRR